MQIYHYWSLRYEKAYQVIHSSSLKVNSTNILQNKINISAIVFKSLNSEFREADKAQNFFLF